MNYSIRAFIFTLFLFNTAFTMEERPADQELNGEKLEIWYRATQQIVNRQNSSEKEIFDDLSALRRTSKLTRQAVDNFVAAVGKTRVPRIADYSHAQFKRDIIRINGFTNPDSLTELAKQFGPITYRGEIEKVRQLIAMGFVEESREAILLAARKSQKTAILYQLENESKLRMVAPALFDHLRKIPKTPRSDFLALLRTLQEEKLIEYSIQRQLNELLTACEEEISAQLEDATTPQATRQFYQELLTMPFSKNLTE